MEDDGIVHKKVCGLVGERISQVAVHQVECLVEEDENTEEGQDQKHQQLVEGSGDDRAEHVSVQHFILSSNASLSTAVELISAVLPVRLSANGNCAKGIHDQVDPQELDNIEASSSQEEGSNHDKGDQSEIDGELELQELSDIVEDNTSPHNSMED